MRRVCVVLTMLMMVLPWGGCAGQSRTRLDYPVEPAVRTHDEIVVSGEFVHTGGAKVVLWFDPAGLDAYEGGAGRRHFGVRFEKDPLLGRLGREDWTPRRLRERVDQIVLHYDAVGSSRGCFAILDKRGLSAHFLIDTDGTIYQTMDVRERAWHATTSNDRSVGIEIANIGAHDVNTSAAGAPGTGKGGSRGVINGRLVEMPRYTPAQEEALAALCAALCRALPRITPNYPQDAHGRVEPRTLDPARLAAFRGILGHYHIQTNKVDPGPALDWEALTRNVRARMTMGWHE